MSGLLSTIGSAIGAAQGLAAELQGDFSQVVLGSVVFSGIEVPETMLRSITQQIEEHVLPGGTVQLQQFGPRTAPITWTGYLEGGTALLRCLQIEAMQANAVPVPLFWFDRVVIVLIETWAPRDKNVNWINYSITCRVLWDLRTTAIQVIGGLISEVASDIGSAIGLGGNLI